jgi:uncharacterized membrane protein YoaK (UPF0700 family)
MSLTPRIAAHAYPLLESVPASAGLALTSSLLDAWTFGQVGTFATVQSGNLLSVGYFAADGDAPRVMTAMASILAFVLGAFVCSLYVLWCSRREEQYSRGVLLFEVSAIGILVLLSSMTPLSSFALACAISFVAGVQGNAFHRETGMLYGNIAVTSVVQMAASLLGRAVGRGIFDDGERHLTPASAYLVVLMAFLLGGGVGFALDRIWASGSLVAAAATLVVIWLRAGKAGLVDPSQNNPTP